MNIKFLLTISLILITLSACKGAGITSPIVAQVDVLEFLIGQDHLWPRSGSQKQDQYVDLISQKVCWNKYGQVSKFECWSWDAVEIKHIIDHAVDASEESYSFTIGTWLPRKLAEGEVWTKDVAENRIQWFDRNCVKTFGPQGMKVDSGLPIFPYRLSARIEAGVFISKDLGTRDVLILDYIPYAPNGTSGSLERFYFARGAGWYRWTRNHFDVRFDLIDSSSPKLIPIGECQ
jgi:hypothetical protein